MKRIDVALGDRSYPILVGEGALGSATTQVVEQIQPTSVAIVSHPRLAELYGRQLSDSVTAAGTRAHSIAVQPGERYKNLKTVERLYRELVALGVDRRGLIVALGGGVLGDICGFVAATYLRGIAFIQAPTTLLAQVDASIGGKTGVDLPEGKNLVGAFHQPRAVLIDPLTLASLPARELRSGLAEVVKYGIITDDRLFGLIKTSASALLGRDPGVLTDVTVRSCEIKADVVAKDETEQGLRAILNFGHTIGHALEVVTGYRRFKHGEAISIGMISACLIGEEAGVTPRDVTGEVRGVLARLRLPSAFPADLDPKVVVAATHQDKKRVGDSVTYILPTAIGSVRLAPGIPIDLVNRALERQREA